MAALKNAMASMRLLRFRNSPKAFQETINTEAKMIIVVVSNAVCMLNELAILMCEKTAYCDHK